MKTGLPLVMLNAECSKVILFGCKVENKKQQTIHGEVQFSFSLFLS
jgi:hypothetical protein